METERDALLEFKRGIRVDRCGLLDSWGVTQDCCMWHGIQCHNHSGHVIALDLPTLSNYTMPEPCLEGTIAESILGLKQLKYIDLGNNNFAGQLPKFIGSLSNLEHLSLYNLGFTGVIPQEIGNLSRLTYLNLNSMEYYNLMRVEDLQWLSQLRLLRVVGLCGIDLSVTTNRWLSVINNLPLLQQLELEYCNLSLNMLSSLSYINSSKTLAEVSLLGNNLNDTSIFEWLSNLGGVENSLVVLDLSNNNFPGQLPKSIGSLSNLERLSLSNSWLTGVIPQEIGNLSRLTYLDLYPIGYYKLRVENLDWLSQLRLLRVLNLGGIDLSVVTNSWLSIVNNLPLLQVLVLENCNLSLKLPSSLSYTNSSKTLAEISFIGNNLNDTTIFEWLSNLGV